jgi:hypothetical protein
MVMFSRQSIFFRDYEPGRYTNGVQVNVKVCTYSSCPQGGKVCVEEGTLCPLGSHISVGH